MKDVDWMPYLTTRLVDDAASHLRLYRQARAKVKDEEASSSPAKKTNQLEKHFFDLELAMEQKQLCRDAVCLDYLKDVSEILLFLLLPESDFQCQPMRMLLRDLLAHAALMPLFELLADPDFINQTIVSLAELRDLPFTGLDDDRQIKQQLSSLLYTKKIIDSRLLKLQEGSENDSTGLKQATNVSGWRASAEQQLSDLHIQKLTVQNKPEHQEHTTDSEESTATQIANIHAMESQLVDNLKSAAKNICEQYLSEKASPRLKIKETYYNRLMVRMNSEFPSETWFDEIQSSVYEILKVWIEIMEEHFLPAFRQSYGYMRLLVELDLMKDPSRSDDEEVHPLENSSSEDLSNRDHTSLNSVDLGQAVPNESLANDHGNKYGIYCIAVVKRSEITGRADSWQICRRYSDFLSMHHKIKERHDDLGKLPFPSKRAFHNTERATLEKRMRELNSWLQLILRQLGPLGPEVEQRYPEVGIWIQTFFQQGDYEQQGSRQFAKTMEQLFMKPIKSSLRTVGNVVRSVPETMSKAIHSRSRQDANVFEASKVGASLDVETSDNIPLRIMLLLLDEVFDLKSRNQWLRRRIINIVRQIVKSMFGDIVNRRILDYVSWLTSPMRVAAYIEFFRDTFWPDGSRAEVENPRTEGDKMRSRVLAKMALLASMTDEIKRIMGTETTRRGLVLVFEMFQQTQLNRRLALVLFEGILVTLFPEHDFPNTFQKLHSLSERTQKSAVRR
ncbi:hypothetical protein B566_EDAN011137 [Ephemera danica]|nr:hypothetical protein B566_EDAN011137 [Ephemera danica]